jgi:hypothetical protein
MQLVQPHQVPRQIAFQHVASCHVGVAAVVLQRRRQETLAVVGEDVANLCVVAQVELRKELRFETSFALHTFNG